MADHGERFLAFRADGEAERERGFRQDRSESFWPVTVAGRFLSGLAGALVLISGWGGALTDARAADASNPSSASQPPDISPSLLLSDGTTLLLEVVINEFPIGKIADFVQRGDRLFIRREDLTALGLREPSGISPGADGLYAIDALPDVSARLDEATQTLYLMAADSALLTNQLHVGARAEGSGAPMESGTGFTFNYDVNAAVTNGHTYGSGLFDGRVFSPLGVASTDFLAFAGGTPGGGAARAPIRLDSTYVYSDFDSETHYGLGDTITGGLAWTRPVRLGGVQITRDFSMRPDLITFPLPSVAGSAAVPSTVDVLVNGTRTLSQQVQPGPFAIPQLPVITGAGQVQLTVTNALGQQVTSTQAFYASSSLLAPDLDTYSVEGGFVRRNWGALSNDYGDFAVSGTYRRGLSDWLTFEAHAEGTRAQFMAGGGLVANLFNFAVFNIGGAGSSFHDRAGGEIALGLQRAGPVFSFGAWATLATHAFSDIATTEGDPVPIRQITASVSTSLGEWGSLGLAWSQIDQPAPLFLGSLGDAPTIVPPAGPELPPSTGPFLPGQNSEILNGSYQVELFHKVFLYANGYHDFAQGGTGATVGITIPLGQRDSVSATGVYQSGSALSGQVQAQRSVSNVGDWGYQAYASSDNHEFGLVQYKAPWALLTAGVDHLESDTTVRAEAQGAVSFIDNRLFPTNIVINSFAVVNTNGVSGVHVLSENRPAGVTDANGQLLVPDLLSWQNNHLAIDPADVPVDAQVPYMARMVRPPDRSGVVVGFPITRTYGALLVLVDEAGQPVPLGSTATLKTTGTVVPVGYDGETFVENLAAADNEVVVQLPNFSRCVVSFAFTPTPGQIPQIGPLTCRKQNP
jgi:outer membrane usher protein